MTRSTCTPSPGRRDDIPTPEVDRLSLVQWVEHLSGGRVITPAESGPVLSPVTRRRTTDPGTFVHALRPWQRAVVMLLTAAWAASFFWFWTWWVEPQHRVSWAGTALNTALLVYVTCVPAYFLLAVVRLREVSPALPVPELAVAFVVTHAPAEEWSVARRTLTAMLAQDFPYPYDVWLCDEEPSAAVRAWCRSHGVRVSSRRGLVAYHRPTWPRRTRCKEGNLSYFYDHWGYRDYEVVAQLDCDHVPAPTYLKEMVRPFADPAVGYVAAPSMCDANAEVCWAARGRAYREANLNGAFQLGHSRGLAPMCIGSHYAVRTGALRDIGGIGPELAEDFSTTFLLNCAGWHGAFAIRAEAHGNGPVTFPDMVTQEFQWSRSLTSMLLDLLPRHQALLPAVLRVRFTYALGYYPLLVAVLSTGLLLSPLAVTAGVPWVNVGLFDFWLHFWPMTGWLLLVLALVRWWGLFRPASAPLFSWESWLYSLTRWPFVAWGVLSALKHRMRPRPVVFAVTPKSPAGPRPLMPRLVAPFATLAAFLSGVAVLGEQTSPQAGYVFLCLLSAATYSLVALAVPVLHMVEGSPHGRLPARGALRTARTALLLGAAPLLPLALALLTYPPYLRELLNR